MSRKVSPAERFRKALMEAVGQASLDFSGYCRLAPRRPVLAAPHGPADIQQCFMSGRPRAWRDDMGRHCVKLCFPKTYGAAPPRQTDRSATHFISTSPYAAPANHCAKGTCGDASPLSFG